MQTEIQWLVDIMLNHKLPSPVKDKFISRIGEVESRLAPAARPVPSHVIQAPSTQKLLEQYPPLMGGNQLVHDEPLPAPVARTIIPKEIETGRGNGTSIKGPRKF